MKSILPIVLALAAIALGVTLYTTKQSDAAQHDSDLGAYGDVSNRLTAAQAQIAACNAAILTYSNSLDQSFTATAVLSNHLTEAESAIDLQAGQITNLTLQVAQAAVEKQTLNRQAANLTNQIAGLSRQIATTQASLAQTNDALALLGKDYVLLEDRLRTDVGERTVVERKFNNLAALKAQMEKLKQNPAGAISTEKILAGLDVEVRSNGAYHVSAPQ